MTQKNLLEQIPVRCANEIGRIDGRARVELPRFRSAPGIFFARILNISPTIKVTLDVKCTAVWDLCDGSRKVEAIAAVIGKNFGGEIEPLYPRLGELFNILERNHMIRFRRD